MVYLIIFTVVVFIFTSIVGNKLKKQNFLIDLKLKNFFQNNNLRFLKSSMKHITSMGDVVTSLIIIFPIFFYSVSEKNYVLASAILNSSLFNMIFLNSFKFLFRREPIGNIKVTENVLNTGDIVSQVDTLVLV